MACFGFQFTAVAVPVQMYALTRSSLWVGLLGVAGLVPLVVFGLWGGAVADAVDRARLLLGRSLLIWLSTLGLLVQALPDVRQPGPAAGADRGAVGGVRDQLAGPQRDHAPAGARPSWSRRPTR